MSLLRRWLWVCVGIVVVGFLMMKSAAVAGGLALLPEQPLPIRGVVSTFALIDHEGKPFTDHEFSGRISVVDFIFTRCAGQCPMMHARMAQLAHRFRHDPVIQFVSLTVDPTVDTPAVLARAAHALNTEHAPWRFVTGDPSVIQLLCMQDFHLAMGEASDDPKEPITHSVRFLLIDPQGRVRGGYDATDAQAMQRLVTDLKRLRRSVP